MANFKYKIFPELNLCYSHFIGKVYIDDVLELVLAWAADRAYIPTISSMMDFRDAEPHFNIEDSKKYINFIQNNSKVRDHRLVALLTSEDQKVEHLQAYQNLAKGLPMTIEIFTDLGESMRWMKNPHPNMALLAFIQERKKILF